MAKKNFGTKKTSLKGSASHVPMKSVPMNPKAQTCK